MPSFLVSRSSSVMPSESAEASRWTISSDIASWADVTRCANSTSRCRSASLIDGGVLGVGEVMSAFRQSNPRTDVQYIWLYATLNQCIGLLGGFRSGGFM